MPNTQVGIPLKSLPKQRPSSLKIVVGTIRISKCKFADNKEHGI
jgi:hypothetical protein